MRRLIIALLLTIFSLTAHAEEVRPLRHHTVAPVEVPLTDNPFSIDLDTGLLVLAPMKPTEQGDPNDPAPLFMSFSARTIPETFHSYVERKKFDARMIQKATYEGYHKFHPYGPDPSNYDPPVAPTRPLTVSLFSNLVPSFVVGLTINPSSGSYSSGQSFVISMQANAPVVVAGGTPTITLNTTPSTTTASYCGGSGSAFLSFCYTATTNLAAPLATTGATFAANGATLTTASGPLNITNVNNVAFGVNIIAPGTGPTVVGVTSNPSSGSWPTNTPITFYVQFSGNILLGGTGTPTLNLGTSPASSASCANTSGVYLICTYVVGTGTQNPVTTTGAAIALNGGTLTGSGGNASLTGANSLTLAGLSFTSPGACVGTQYYISNQGNDSNNGTSKTTAWQTSGHVSSVTSYGPNDCASFNGSDALALGYIVNQTLTVTNVVSGTIHVNDTSTTPAALIETSITAFGSGSGSTGTYTLGTTDSQTVGSAAQPVLFSFGQAFAVPTSITDVGSCFSISHSNVAANSGTFTINTYGGPTAALISNSSCATAFSSNSAIAAIDGVNTQWNGLGVYANGQGQFRGLLIQNQRGSTISSVVVQNMACVDIKAGASVGSSGRSDCFYTTPDNPITTVTLTGITATGGSGPSSSGDEGIAYPGGTITNYIVQGFECKNFGGRNIGAESGACAGSLAQPTAGLFQYFFIHDIGWNVYQCGGESGIELYNGRNFTTQFGEIWNIRPATWNSGTTQSGGCDDDGYDNDDSASSVLQYVYTHDNFGTGIYGFVGNSYTTWGPFTVRYNVSINDGYGHWPGNRLGAVGLGNSNSSGCYYLYNNTIIKTDTTVDSNGYGSFAFQGGGVPGCGIVANNIFAVYADSGGRLDFMYFYSNTTPSLTYKSNAYVALSAGSFFIHQYGGSDFTSLTSWQGTVPGGETGATQANPHFLGTPGAGIFCGPNGTGANQPQGNQGPQPCPQQVKLTSASTAYLGTGYPVSSPGIQDYYNESINPSAPNIGADGGNP